jgi:hypothetical protein
LESSIFCSPGKPGVYKIINYPAASREVFLPAFGGKEKFVYPPLRYGLAFIPEAKPRGILPDK